MARPKKYTQLSLEKADRAYFDSISRDVIAQERVDTGKRDPDGHKIYELKPILDRRGKQIVLLEYVVPPTVGGLCNFLGIDRSTWANYADIEQHPEHEGTVSYARSKMRAWLEEQLLTRKDVRGVIFDLQNNYGYTERRELELGARAERVAREMVPLSERENLLREIAREFGGDADGGAGGS